MASRQAEWAKARRAAGKCGICGEPEGKAKGYCDRHQEQRTVQPSRNTGAKLCVCSGCGNEGHNIRTCPDPKVAKVGT